jgi:hypothetical protein
VGRVPPGVRDPPRRRSARELMFARAVGFAPAGEYWRRLRRVASTNLFAPRRVAAHKPGRLADADAMVSAPARRAGWAHRVSAPRSAGRAKAHQVASVHEEAAAVPIAMFAGSRLLDQRLGID